MDMMHTPTCTLGPITEEGDFVRNAKRTTFLGYILTEKSPSKDPLVYMVQAQEPDEL